MKLLEPPSRHELKSPKQLRLIATLESSKPKVS